MLAIANEQGKITISFEEFLAFFKMEFLARQSRLSDQAALDLSEQIKTDWWSKHQQQLLAKTGI
jgi:hypothetical protein